jgi:hypothetical protein
MLLELSLCKARVRARKQLQALRVLQKQFGHKVFLVSSKRVFQRAADIVKLSEKDKTKGDRHRRRRQQYRFFLFNDLLIYAAGSPPSYKVHQALHLSLARLCDHEHTLTHDFISPQKSFTLQYPDRKTKYAWMSQLARNIEAQRTAHHNFALEIDQKKNAENKTRTPTAGGANNAVSKDGAVAQSVSNSNNSQHSQHSSTRDNRVSSLGAPLPQAQHTQMGVGSMGSDYEAQLRDQPRVRA